MVKTLRIALASSLYLILLTPLFFYQSFVDPFIIPKTFIFQGLVEIAAALWLGLMLFDPSVRPRWNWLSGSLAAFLGFSFLSGFLGVDVQRSLWSVEGRALGLVALAHFALFAWILGSLKNTFDWKKYWSVSFVVSVTMSILAICERVNPYWFLDTPAAGGLRPGSTLGNPSFFASYLLFHIFAGLWLSTFFFKEKDRRKKVISWIFLGCALFETLIIFQTQTRGAILGLGAGILALLLCAYFRPEEWWDAPKLLLKRIALVLIALAVVVPLGFWTTRHAAFWQKVPGLSRLATLSASSADIQPRLMTLNIAWQSFKERPWLGYGFENFKYPFDRHYNPRTLEYGFNETYFDKAHNMFAEYLVTGGIFGFLLYVGLLGTIIWRLFRMRRSRDFLPFGVAIIVSYAVQNAFLFDTFGSYLMLFLLIGFVVAEDVAVPDTGKTSVSHFEVRAGAAAILFLLAFVPVYLWSYRTMYADHEQYWGLNYFLNRFPGPALDAYAASIQTPNPYRDTARQDFASNLALMIQQGMDIPDVDNVVKKAMTELATAINDHPNDYLVRLAFVDAATVVYPLNQNYLALADQQIEQAMKASPGRQQIYYSAAKIKVIEGDPQAALALMQYAVALDPNAADPHFYYGLTAFEAGNSALGFQEIDKAKAMGRGPQAPDEARLLGDYYGDAGRYDEAITFYSDAIQANSSDLESQLKLGLVYYYSGQNDKARVIFEAVAKQVDLTKSPNYAALRQIYKDVGLTL